MSSREMFDLEPGDTGEALLVSGVASGVHADRDASEAPGHGSTVVEADKVNGRSAHKVTLLTLSAGQYAQALREAEAKALRDLAGDLNQSRLTIKDGGSAYIDLYLRAVELERGFS